MSRNIDKLTIYYPQDCIAADKPHIIIKRVETQKQNRLSRTYGNVNLTDYWFSILEDFLGQDMSYTTQHIMLLSDDDQNWWENQINEGRNYICLCFVKVDVENSIKIVKNRIESNGDRFHYFYTFGNADFIIAFSGKDEEDIQKTYGNIQLYEEDFFSIYMLYGEGKIEEDSCKISDFRIDSANRCKRHELYIGGWCSDVVKELREHMKEDMKQKNKKMLSYYHVLLQIMNVVSQYEQETIYKDLFYIFFPPISLFLDQLKKGEDEIKSLTEKQSDDSQKNIRQKYRKQKELETSISEFVDAIEVLMHHMGQSCRDIIGDSGRGGLPYDIPIRLCFMYIAYLNVLTTILNDNQEYEYQYSLAPLAYSRPTTKCLGFGLEPGNRLIRLQISKAMMFMPRSLLVILVHEVGHYVGDSTRLRSARATCYMHIAVAVTCYALASDDILGEIEVYEDDQEYALLSSYIKNIRLKITWYLLSKSSNEWKRSHENYKYYLENFITDFSGVMRTILSVMNSELLNNIYCVDQEVLYSLRQSEIGADRLFEKISAIHDRIKHRTGYIWDSDIVQGFLESMAKNFKEIYADLGAILLLELKPLDFFETYLISESFIPEEDSIKSELINRFALVTEIMSEADSDWKDWKEKARKMNEQADDPEKDDLEWSAQDFVDILQREIGSYLKIFDEGIQNENTPEVREKENQEKSPTISETDFFYNVQIVNEEKTYLVECFKKLKANFAEKVSLEFNGKSRQEILQDFYKHFKVNERNKDDSFENFFDSYSVLVECYKYDVNKKLQEKR